MITERFERLFGRLVAVFKQHQDVPRTPDHVRELGSARWDLQLARGAIAVERQRIADRTAARARNPRQAAVSDDDLGRLRAFGAGYIGG